MKYIILIYIFTISHAYFDWLTYHKVEYTLPEPLTSDWSINWKGTIYDYTLHELAQEFVNKSNPVLFIEDDMRSFHLRLEQRFLKNNIDEIAILDLTEHILQWSSTLNTYIDYGAAYYKTELAVQQDNGVTTHPPDSGERDYSKEGKITLIRWTNKFRIADRQTFFSEPRYIYKETDYFTRLLLVDCDLFHVIDLGRHEIKYTKDIINAIWQSHEDKVVGEELDNRIIKPWQSINGKVSLRYGWNFYAVDIYTFFQQCKTVRWD